MPDSHREDARRQELRRFAEGHGLAFSPEIPEGILDPRFYLFSLNMGEVIGWGANYMTGGWKGASVSGFDYAYEEMEEVSPVPGVIAYRDFADPISVAMVELDADLAYMYVERKDLLTRVADDLDRLDHMHHDHLGGGVQLGGVRSRLRGEDHPSRVRPPIVRPCAHAGAS